MSELKLISGASGLSNEITSVNIMDNPDALDWFSPGEILLTSGYFVRDSREAQNTMMQTLRSIHCPALCIKPMRYLSTIPKNIIQLGDELSIPVIELPYGIPFSHISSILWENLSTSYDKTNRRSLDIHEEFFRATLQSQGLANIAGLLARMIRNPVVFLDSFYNILAWEDLPDNPVPLRLVAQALGGSSLLDQEYISSLPPSFETLQTPVCRRLDSLDVDTVIIPVYVLNVHYGYILVWRTLNELSSIDYTALKSCTMTFALERIRSQEVNRARNRIRRDFFQDLLRGAITDRENLNYLCGVHKLNPALYYVPIILSLDFSHPAQQDLLERKQQEDINLMRILRLLDNWEGSQNTVLHAFSYHGQVILLLGFQPEQQKSFSTPAIKALCRELVTLVKTAIPELRIQAGIGSVSSDLMILHRSYRQAQEVLRLAQKERTEDSIHHYQDFVVHRFLESNVQPTEMHQYFQETLGPLYQHDQRSGNELLPTLEAWIENHCNIVQTARALYTHRNTVIYRIERISALLNTNLKNPEELLKYQLALKIYHLLDLSTPHLP